MGLIVIPGLIRLNGWHLMDSKYVDLCVFNFRIKQLRYKRCEVASAIGVTSPALSQFLKGEMNLSVNKLLLLIKFLKLDYSDVFIEKNIERSLKK